MKMNRNLLAVGAGLIICVVVVWFSTSIQGDERTYEIRPQVAVPYGYTPTLDTSRVVDAYERLVQRYMDLTERNLTGISTDVQGIVKRLDSIDARLTELSARMSRIEKALGIEEPKNPSGKKPNKKPLPLVED
ncbi:MAG TPA: hypothetical protein ENH43_03395 [Phycisphaerales bacterium]|nr:hypothetical protein [Phycisphaerales bacterium]